MPNQNKLILTECTDPLAIAMKYLFTHVGVNARPSIQTKNGNLVTIQLDAYIPIETQECAEIISNVGQIVVDQVKKKVVSCTSGTEIDKNVIARQQELGENHTNMFCLCCGRTLKQPMKILQNTSQYWVIGCHSCMTKVIVLKPGVQRCQLNFVNKPETKLT